MSEQDFKTTFARNLTFMLEQNDMSQADLARSLGVNESTVHSWITAKKSPRMGRVDEMCKRTYEVYKIVQKGQKKKRPHRQKCER